MTNILTSDVRTYVRELISKEFGSVNNEDNAHSERMAAVNGGRDKKTNCPQICAERSVKL